MDAELAKLLGTGGVAGALLFLIYLVGMRIVKAIDKLITRVELHETTEFAHHAEVKQEIVAMRTEIRQAIDVKAAVQEAVEEVSSGVHEVPDWTTPVTGPFAKRKPTRGG